MCLGHRGLSTQKSAGRRPRHKLRQDTGRCRAVSQGYPLRRKHPADSRLVHRCQVHRRSPADMQRLSASPSRAGSTSQASTARCTAASPGRWRRRRRPRGTGRPLRSSSWPGSSRPAGTARCRPRSAGQRSSRRCPAGTRRPSRLSSPRGTRSRARMRPSMRQWPGRRLRRRHRRGTAPARRCARRSSYPQGTAQVAQSQGDKKTRRGKGLSRKTS